MSSIYIIYRIDLNNLNVEGLFMAPTITQANSVVRKAVNDFIITEEGVKKANSAFELLEDENTDVKKVVDGICLEYIDDKKSI